MTEQVLTDALILFEGVDLSGEMNSVQLDLSVEPQDSTTFGNTTRERRGGLKDFAMSGAGFFESATPDADLFADVGDEDSLITVSATRAEGDRAFMMRSMLQNYSPMAGDSVGDLHQFRLDAVGHQGDLIRALLGHRGAETATGNADGFQLGAIASGQSIFVGTHITALAGTSPTLQVIIQSDDNAGFTSATDRITFSAASAIGSQFASLAGPITDDYWRVRYVIGGSGGPSVTFTTSFGIQSS